MSQELFPRESWGRAAALLERRESLRTPGVPAPKVDAERAERRLRRWREGPALSADEAFHQRLEMDGLTREELLTLLGEAEQPMAERLGEEPRWVADLLEAYARPLEAPSPIDGQSTFRVVVEPLLRLGRERMRQGLERILAGGSASPVDVERVLESLLSELPLLLVRQMNRTLVLELNVARLEGKLEGKTPSERFQSFLSQLRQPERMLTLLREYPVLARQVASRLASWLEVGLEVVQRLYTDWDKLRRFLGPELQGRLVSVESGAGDRHRGGRAVAMLVFDSGYRLVYKPRPMAVDVHFQQLLEWLNDRGQSPSLRTLRVLDRGAYGWSEFIEPRGCDSREQVHRFYQRQGACLALLYAIEATDFHFENIIAAGEYPMLIDLESLLHPYVRRPNDTELAVSALFDEQFYSVLRVGLLPQRQWANEDSAGIDISGLGGSDGQLSPRGVPFMESAGTDEMHVARKRMAMEGSNNRPRLEGKDVNVLEYSADISEGFRGMYELLLRHRAELLAPEGPLARFAQDEVRVLMRPTMVYGLFLLESFHPDMLRDALDRDRFFDRLLTNMKRSPHLPRIVPAEQAALRRGDIPLFYTQPQSHDMWSCGGHHVRDFFERSGLEVVRQRLEGLSAQDLEHQLWLVQASLATLAMDPDRPELLPYRLEDDAPPATRERLLAAARNVGDRLVQRALRGASGGVSWFGLDRTRERRWSLQVLGPQLYSGLSGVVLFLAYLGEVTREETYRQVAREAADTLWRQLGEQPESVRNIGAYEGWGGLVHVCVHLARLWKEPLWWERAEWAVGKLAERVDTDDQHGLIGGAAGALVTLLELHRERPSEAVLSTAVRCGERLLAQAERTPVGLGWRTPMDPHPLGGFSHGVSGIAWALEELAAVTHEERFRQAASEALAYERSLYSDKARNWKDVRDTGGAPGDEGSFMWAWCHGAPGIGLGRLALLRHGPDARLSEEVALALESTRARGFGANHSLCHGDLGNLELFHQTGLQLGEPRWREETSRLAGRILQSLETQGPRCGLPLGVESPGLLNGLAGIGYELLRLANPEQVPSVLTLEPPRA